MWSKGTVSVGIHRFLDVPIAKDKPVGHLRAAVFS